MLGLAGLALLRAGAERRFDEVEGRRTELAAILAALGDEPYAERRALPQRDVAAGYAGWAASYDDPGNDTVALEGPLVRGLLDALPAGPVLDAACGTGRHTGYLLAAGREVIGVDSSEAMLAVARRRLPGADLRVGDLAALPLPDASVAGAVCALALSHEPVLGPTVAELARVLHPGARLVISNQHPLATGVLGWRCVFRDPDTGERTTIPEYPHTHGDYLEAFAAAGLVARRCLEPPLTHAQARARGKGLHPELHEAALTGLPAVIVWEAEREG